MKKGYKFKCSKCNNIFDMDFKYEGETPIKDLVSGHILDLRYKISFKCSHCFRKYIILEYTKRLIE